MYCRLFLCEIIQTFLQFIFRDSLPVLNSQKIHLSKILLCIMKKRQKYITWLVYTLRVTCTSEERYFCADMNFVHHRQRKYSASHSGNILLIKLNVKTAGSYREQCASKKLRSQTTRSHDLKYYLTTPFHLLFHCCFIPKTDIFKKRK